MVYVPVEPWHDRVDVCDAPKTISAGLKMHVRPDGDAEEARWMVPVNPLSGTMLIVEKPVAPNGTVTFVGLAVTEKSTWLPILTVMLAE